MLRATCRAVIPDPRAARSLRFSPSENGRRFARTVDGCHPSTRDGPCAHGNLALARLAGREPHKGLYWFS